MPFATQTDARSLKRHCNSKQAQAVLRIARVRFVKLAGVTSMFVPLECDTPMFRCALRAEGLESLPLHYSDGQHDPRARNQVA